MNKVQALRNLSMRQFHRAILQMDDARCSFGARLSRFHYRGYEVRNDDSDGMIHLATGVLMPREKPGFLKRASDPLKWKPVL
jgi:hypothetical protein